ncbi:hypothetical protein GCM10011512_04240 [Tersicoccus solisilvae]|uniref:DUF4126 domain-containing protein n=1 Tax=Tersicoccus solisilvae TaxID=1882339 RepID=A0ABQ1NMA6_9MICC|nr:hypothetical protein [Tersicoccus solisilvae]GGC80640.1 hypothetical protein GCM10011512_04240 [Tersicoccus solisilvae]
MTNTLIRGIIAGAAGTAALNAVTYADMVLRGRPASDAPGRTVEAALSRFDVQIPGRGPERDNRRSALGAVGGIAVGVGIGVLAGAARSAGLRFSGPTGAALTGAAAMAASDVPMAALKVSDPRTWSPADWATDAAGHLAYGIATRATLTATEPGLATDATLRRVERRARRRAARPSFSLTTRSAVLGVAAGIRSSLGVAGPTFASGPGRVSAGRRAGQVAAALAVAGEMVADKLPGTPSRLQPGALAGRLISGATGAVTLARRERATLDLPVVAGIAGALAGSWGGAAWRGWAQRELGWTWQAALLEDGLGLGLAALGSRRVSAAAQPAVPHALSSGIA